MIPIGDQGAQQGRGFPVVNITIIVVNVAMFLFQLAMGDKITNGWSLVPREITTGHDLIGLVTIPGLVGGIQLYAAPAGNVYLTLLTSMFMHGGWLHIGSNMLFLFIFGDNVEYNFGSVKYLIFYLLCGFGSEATQIFLGGPNSPVPNLGASGAIAGVLAAYLILFPKAQVRTLIFLGFFGTIAAVPAIIMIGIWIVTQVISVFPLSEQAANGGVAYWAHVGGFITGAILVWIFRDRTHSTTVLDRFGTTR